MEEAFTWLLEQFDREKIIARKILRPVSDDFPVTFNQTEDDANALLPLIAAQMEIDPNLILLDFYDQSLMEFGSAAGKIFSQQTPGERYSAGLYHNRQSQGKFRVSIETAQLKNTENLVATLAHEFAHIKLIGEKRITENDEYLTDLVPVIYGLGIFNANASFRFYTSNDSWGYQQQGYLKQQEWGYALALYAHIRNEGEKQAWSDFLVPNIRSDFKKSAAFLAQQPPFMPE
ncbi:hypothetical protein ACFOTA_24275 [Chitinophaga sp. GCM10012297]|uniref:DUF2268 domain-containing protein n=1 Tax=Chitinophaga chungangae TaxID=2821488 RepID=A0ABS3YLR8_9BACT|nr:hypothetical protein [Chitinophaga chungangae]MBO9155350.1 hypothetical protein [Chitinophaga chungangae]